MRLINMVCMLCIFLVLSLLCDSEIINWLETNYECSRLEKSLYGNHFIYESIKKFTDKPEEWKDMCKSLWDLDYIEYYFSEDKTKICGKWNGDGLDGIVFWECSH